MNPEQKNERTVLDWAKFYHDLGFKTHWLRSGSKIPIEVGWQSKKRDDLNTLLKKYRNGYGLGICTGTDIEGGFLFVIDLDLRTEDRRYYNEAMAVIDDFLPGIRDQAPFAQSGRGFGSGHIYGISATLPSSKKLGRSTDMVKVFSPSSPEQEKSVKDGKLTPQEHANGWRIKAAWEVELFSVGKQVVAPPTVHPDTKVPYKWIRGLQK